VGRSVLWNSEQPLRRHGFSGQCQAPSVLGIKAYPSVKDLPDKVELVVITAATRCLT